ncbi:hypothetical protein P9B03_01165 [Metasolibacillus meyeri]|uniref:Uncharacterized protein n=1 Tax=Metasolibacillus meyeri TaxID=1071052 RepID=A0AAW9NFC2_9BACL|nr:hypothetical protein [Metasolibacillus meyeri]MEC1177079.1 hypothetical protein [Metasolibacillus meyeri]
MAISLMEAYLIESLRQNYSYEQVAAQLENKDLSLFAEMKSDFSLLQQLFDTDKELFKEAYTTGYQVKFLTINGLKNILRMRFGIDEHQYELQEFGAYNVPANEETAKAIAALISSNWKIERNGETINIFV